MSFHRNSIGLEVHVPHTFTYADAAARVAAVSTDFTDPDDLFKLARQTSDTTYWVLEQIAPSVTWNQLGGGGGAAELPFDAITDPAVDAAVTTAKIDLFSGTVITLTAAGNSQTLQAPTDTTAGRKFFVLNNDTSNNTVPVNGVTLSSGQYVEFRWDGDTWLLTAGGLAAGAGGLNTQIQYNDNGSLNGDPNHTWDEVTKKEIVLGDIEQVGGIPGNLYTPTVVATLALGAAPRNSVALGNYVFVVDSTAADLKIIDVTDPALPAQVGIVAGLGTCRGVDIAGRYVFVASASGGGLLNIVDAQDKGNPVLVSTLVVGGTPRGVRVLGRTVFVTGNGSANGLISVDVSDPVNPVILQAFDTGVAIRTEFDVVGTIAYIVSAATANNLKVIDVSDPANMVTLASLDIGDTVWAVKVQGRYAYVVQDSGSKFDIFDVADPANTSNVPVGTVQLAVGASGRALDVVGNFAYVADAALNVLYVIDVSDPTTPVHIASALAIGQNPVSISTVGRYGYITDNTDDNLQVIDFGGIEAQNLNVGNIDVGDLNVRRDVKAAGNLNANAAVLGAGGIFSDGPVVAAGRRLGGQPKNFVEVYKEADLPINGSVIELAVATEYVLMAPVSTDKRIRLPESGAAFSPTVLRSTSKYGNVLTSTGAGPDSLFFSTTGQGQLVLQNIRIEETGSRPFAVLTGLTQTALLLELDDCDVVGFSTGTIFTTCIFNANNASFWTGSGTFKLIDCECNLADMFHANFVDTSVPTLRVQSSAPAAPTKTFVTVRDSKLSSQANESFFMLHSNLVAGSTLRLTGVENSPFTPGTGAFFASETGSITSLGNSGTAPGVRTLVNATGHTIAEGDTITQSGFATQTQYNGTFVVSNVIAGISYEVTVVFIATDTGTWTDNSLDQGDPKVTASDNPGRSDSRTIGSCHVNGNATVTVIAALNTYTDLNLNAAALAGSNIERWSLTDTTTGELTYNGVEPFSGTIFAQLSTLGETGSPEYRFRAVKNGVALADGIESVREAGAVQIVTTGLIAPVSVVTGDTIRLQVNNIDNAEDITITHLSVSIQ